MPEIIDFHMHFMTQGTWEEFAKRRLASDVARQHSEKKLKIGGNESIVLPESAAQAAQWWLEHLDKNGVAAGGFMSGMPENQTFYDFLSKSNRFIGYTWLKATDPDAPQVLEREVKAGMRCVKLYPPSQQFHLNDRAAWPFYEMAARLDVPILIHMGITMGYQADLKYGNPLDLHAAARDFPDVTFVVAHFGAGFLRECLMLAYQLENVSFDSSGSNMWMKYLPYPITLEDVFRKVIDVAGARRILYGSDSTVFPRGYRTQVLQEQLAVLDRLDLSAEDKALILGGNARRLLKLETKYAVEVASRG
ncbi:MAG TPA: amidohydrolase family protein [Candidatus Xenobia bacterium]|jgi:hypothetical protein